MFESICLKNLDNGGKPIDLGMLVECMLFYRKTNVIADYAILKYILSEFDIDRTIDLIDADLLNIYFLESMPVVIYAPVILHTSKGDIHTNHYDAGVATPGKPGEHSFTQNSIEKICIEITGKQGKGRRLARRIANKINFINKDVQNAIAEAKKIFNNQSYLKAAIPVILKDLVPEYKIDNLEFNTRYISSGYIIDTNIDFERTNELYHQRIPKNHSSIDPALIFSRLLSVEYDLFFSATYLSEIATNSMHSDLIQQRCSYLISKSNDSRQQLSSFQEVLFQGKSIREAVNKKQVDLDDLLKVLKESTKFKHWLANKSPTANLLTEYSAEVTNKSFIDKLPNKMVRFVLFNGAGLVTEHYLHAAHLVTIAGLGLSSIDYFVLDRLIHGWRPNQFIDEVRRIII